MSAHTTTTTPCFVFSLRVKGHAAPVTAVQCDEHRVVSAATDGTVSVWDIRSGQELFQIYGHADGVNSLQFDREQLVTDGEPMFDILLYAGRVVVSVGVVVFFALNIASVSAQYLVAPLPAHLILSK